jgi:FtsP/CotA-like multicopper oxidase with cupredoxin domain
VNGSFQHPMHLHGFYFTVNARGRSAQTRHTKSSDAASSPRR